MSLPGGPYDEGLFNHLRLHFPEIELVVMTMQDDPHAWRYLCTHGVKAIVHKEDCVTEIAQAIRHVARGVQHFGSRVKAVLERGDYQTV